MNQNFEELKEYFLNLSSKDMLTKSNNHSFIDLNWIFTDLVSREVIESAVINLLKKERPNNERVQNLKGIEGFEIIKNKGRLLFQALGTDNWTKINFTDDESIIEEAKDKNIKTYSFENLRDEIREVLGNKDLDEANSKLILVGLEKAFEDACGNLLKYYQYLLEEKEENAKHTCIINQRNDILDGQRHFEGRPSVPRVNEIIEFCERGEFLESLNPSAKIDIEEVDEKGNIQPAYHVYMYEDDLLANSNNETNGYLFIAEPIMGDRGTRVFYISPEEFKEYEVEEGKDKISELAGEYLEMSPREFANKKVGTTVLAHTDLETYKERIKFYKDATKSKSLTNLKQYTKSLSKLYGKEITLPYYKPKTASDIGKIGVGAHNIDRVAQVYLDKEEKDTGEVFDS